MALRRQLTATHRRSAATAALMLARIDPVRFRPAEYFEPIFMELSAHDARRLLAVMRESSFAPLVRTPWAAAFVGAGLDRSDSPVRDPADPDEAAVRLEFLATLESVGTFASNSIPALVRRFPDTNVLVRTAAALAFTSVAADRADCVPLIRPYLTNANVAPPLLLWLTSLGTNSVGVYDKVLPLAIDLARIPGCPVPSRGMDTSLARRYGLRRSSIGCDDMELAETTTATYLYRTLPKPSSFSLYPADVCPRRLVPLWPGLAANHTGILRDYAMAKSDVSRSEALSHLYPTTLAELARRCVVAMTNGVPERPRGKL